MARLQAAYTKTQERDTINREWSSTLKINEDKQLQRETRALEIRRGTTIMVAFGDLTALSHVSDEPQLALHLYIRVLDNQALFIYLGNQVLCSSLK